MKKGNIESEKGKKSGSGCSLGCRPAGLHSMPLKSESEKGEKVN